MGAKNPNIIAEAQFDLDKYDTASEQIIEKLPLIKPDTEGGPPEVLTTFPLTQDDYIQLKIKTTIVQKRSITPRSNKLNRSFSTSEKAAMKNMPARPQSTRSKASTKFILPDNDDESENSSYKKLNQTRFSVASLHSDEPFELRVETEEEKKEARKKRRDEA